MIPITLILLVEKSPEFDWTVAITHGMRKDVEWVLEPGYELAQKGLIFLTVSHF